MNKQEAIDELENAIPDFILNDFQRGKETGLTYALELVEQLNDPEKPVVPQFVADWYEKYKNDFEYNLYRLCINFHERKLHEDLHEWFKFDKNKPIETLILMHKFGYEVEKEKLYTVELPNPNSPEHFVLRKNGVNKIIADCYLSDNWKLYKNTWLTESEIKKDFEWAWQLAKEVEE
ncbi:DUF1642 domain-containing protein [Streptococcus gallolyticus]|uniref:DUF1642 domain-containing protein n=1 Tax=Streptococcus gallolyticus TaxID=315405 RepID=UPI0001E0F2B0|nr:DUF1642 domain-containing protein [Streptococcus gallolyticus]EFM30274.1 hypothetical protein HMPREF9352_0388 [Streptococcus gallolyticus subsp. gallolyticus TX20005]QBX15936.1 hypothetical protein Javan227_0026 [Streptococcus phage Javan227]QKI01126.1 DUF1642 domain-containing protein [Streptococcus gallolyticus]QWX87197.1 DUF1642 domain-containing protein [Streptococcus gallolyticus subsp. gallolyticus TX20005]